MLAFVYGSSLPNLDLGDALRSQEKFLTWVEAQSGHDGLFAKAVRRSGLAHDGLGPHRTPCRHGCHLAGIVIDGNQDMDRPRTEGLGAATALALRAGAATSVRAPLSSCPWGTSTKAAAASSSKRFAATTSANGSSGSRAPSE